MGETDKNINPYKYNLFQFDIPVDGDFENGKAKQK